MTYSAERRAAIIAGRMMEYRPGEILDGLRPGEDIDTIEVPRGGFGSRSREARDVRFEPAIVCPQCNGPNRNPGPCQWCGS